MGGVMENTLTYKFLSLLFVNDDWICKEIYDELGIEERNHLEEFFKLEKSLWDWIIEWNGVPFSGDEEEYDGLIRKIESKLSTEGYRVYNKILDMC